MVFTSGFLALSALLLSSPVIAAPSTGWLRGAFQKRNVVWQNCTIFGVESWDPNLFCGFYDVPLDYNNTKAGTAKLALAKYVGTAHKKIGTLFTNPGGPGSSGLELIVENGAELAAIFGGTYDIISWDPRGVGKFTVPGEVTCFNSKRESDAFFQNTIVQSINYTIATGFDQQDQDELFARAQEDADLLIDFGSRCQQGPVGDFLPFLGTTSTVRDLVTLADCIVGPDQLIDFWGFSYGSVIASNFLTLFPERAGHVILDGVVDPRTWFTFKFYGTALLDAEKVFGAFGDACAAAGPWDCKLVQLIGDWATGPQIVQLLQDAHDTALELQRAGCDNLPIIPGELIDLLFSTLLVPATWSDFANNEAFPLLVAIFTEAQKLNTECSWCGSDYKMPPGPPPTPSKRQTKRQTGADAPVGFGSQAIIGADDTSDFAGVGRRDILSRQGGGVGIGSILGQLVGNTQGNSASFGASWGTAGSGMSLATPGGTSYTFGWPVFTVEPLPKPSFSKLKNPVLLIGNEFDPITPFVSALNTAELIGDLATVVEQNGVGHTSAAQLSTCTLTIIANYLVNNQLPECTKGQAIQCEIDDVPSNDLFPPLNSTSDKRSMSMLMRALL